MATTANAVDPDAAPAQLSDRALAVLEATLRVQLQVSKCVRAAQVTGAMGAAALSGPLAAIPSSVSVVSSQVQRVKLKRRHRAVVREMEARGLGHVVGAHEATRLGKRAYAISVATGLACCLLAFSADVLIDRAVVQVVSEVAMGYLDEMAMGSLAGHVAAQLATPAPGQPQYQQVPQQAHQQLKTKTRSWGGFRSKWRSKRETKRAESLPPDLFGEREAVPALPIPSVASSHIEVQRSSEFAPFGECLVLRFSTVVPGEDPHLGMEELERESAHLVFEDVERVDAGALSERQWRSLWTLEDGPIDVLDDLNDEDYDLFGTDDYDLFGAVGCDTDELLVENATAHDYDLFGVQKTSEEPAARSEPCDLFGLHDRSRRNAGG